MTQKDKLAAAHAVFARKQHDLRKKYPLTEETYDAFRKDWVKLHERTREEMLLVLTETQLARWTNLTGADFTFRPDRPKAFIK
jgi:hypothetical protein